jgi:hypothetical protein
MAHLEGEVVVSGPFDALTDVHISKSQIIVE